MKIKRETITPQMWAMQQPEFSWGEGIKAFLKRKPPSLEDLIVETRIYNKFEIIMQNICGGLLTIVIMGIGPILMILALAMFIGIYAK